MDSEAADAALKKADNAVRAEMRKAKAQQASEDEDEDTETDWRDTLLSTLKTMEPYAFERLSMRLLREAGFRNYDRV